MLLIHPIKELIRFLPVVVGIFIAGSAPAEMRPGTISASRSPSHSASCAT